MTDLEHLVCNIGPADLEHIAEHATRTISNGGLSDLLFNHDFSHCKDSHGAWLWGALAAEIESFRTMALSAGIKDTPGVRALAEDFFARM